jgi:hypothetical protein
LQPLQPPVLLLLLLLVAAPLLLLVASRLAPLLLLESGCSAAVAAAAAAAHVPDASCLPSKLVLQASSQLSSSPNPKQPPTLTLNLDWRFRCSWLLWLLPSVALLLVLFLFLLLLLRVLPRLLSGCKLLRMRRKGFSRPLLLLLLLRTPALLSVACVTLQDLFIC